MSDATPVKLAVLGGGAWGTALAIAYAKHFPVTLWVRDAAQAAALAETRQNGRYLPGCAFPDQLTVTADLSAAMARPDAVLLVTPISGFRATLQALRDLNFPLPPVFWACKGFEAETNLLPHQVVEQVLGKVPCGVISGPSFAKEVAAGQPTAVTLACADIALAKHWAARLNLPRLRLYATDDVIGVEVGGAVKNVLAIAAGVADGLGLGVNARAALITRGLAEMGRLAGKLGGRPETLTGLAGMGDLVLTATGDLSRNRRVGLLLAEGQTLAQVLAALGHVAEGVPAAFETERMATVLSIQMPITHAVCRLLRGECDAQAALSELLSRAPGLEFAAS